VEQEQGKEKQKKERTSRLSERMMVSVVMSSVTRVPGVRDALSSLNRQPTT
jgi:hypothetical protein